MTNPEIIDVLESTRWYVDRYHTAAKAQKREADEATSSVDLDYIDDTIRKLKASVRQKKKYEKSKEKS